MSSKLELLVELRFTISGYAVPCATQYEVTANDLREVTIRSFVFESALMVLHLSVILSESTTALSYIIYKARDGDEAKSSQLRKQQWPEPRFSSIPPCSSLAANPSQACRIRVEFRDQTGFGKSHWVTLLFTLDTVDRRCNSKQTGAASLTASLPTTTMKS